MTPTQIQERLDALAARGKELMSVVSGGERDLSAEEIAELEAATDEQDRLLTQRRAFEQVSTMVERHDAPTGRLTTPTAPESEPVPRDRSITQVLRNVGLPVPGRITGGEPSYAVPGADGFRSIREFGNAVFNATTGRGVDERLGHITVFDQNGREVRMSTGQSIGVGEEGGYALPGPLAVAGVDVLFGAEDNLANRCESLPTSGNTVYLSVNEEAPWQDAGVRAYWEGEREQHTLTTAKVGGRTERLSKLTVFVRMTEEEAEDSAMMGALLELKSPQAISTAMNRGIITGNGVGMPLGWMNSGGLVTVAKETGQAAGTIVAENIGKMWGRMYAPHRQNAVWLINQDLEPFLERMFYPIKEGAANVGGWPVYVPANGIAGRPFDTLKNREIVFSEHMKTVGNLGDILLVNFGQYRILNKTSPQAAFTSSIHLYFDTDQIAFKWRMRANGSPRWPIPMPREAAGAQPLSNHVTLAERA